LGRQAIMNDPDWRNGDYYEYGQPQKGLSLARQIAMISYRSEREFAERFGRDKRPVEGSDALAQSEERDRFQVESYLRYQGSKFVERFDANSFLYITKAADYFDLEQQHGGGSIVQAFSGVQAKFLVVSFTSDWLYPTYQSKTMVKAMKKNGIDVSFCEIEANCGHDAFLLPNERLTRLIRGFLEGVFHEIGS
ncbi:MAG: alpha/beta fold hydrolase, partial [Deltaproteobacteria bacterium]